MWRCSIRQICSKGRLGTIYRIIVIFGKFAEDAFYSESPVPLVYQGILAQKSAKVNFAEEAFYSESPVTLVYQGILAQKSAKVNSRQHDNIVQS